MEYKVLVVIPARGGSKGVPKKNIKVLGDKPLLAHAIDCAKASAKTTKIVVTTDSEEIAAVAQEYQCDVIVRPAALADDTSNVVTAVEHVLQNVKEPYDIIVLLQPTSPLRTGQDLDNVIAILENNTEVEAVISVVPLDDLHPARMYNIVNQKLSPFVSNGETLRRQDLQPVYYRNGCFYAIRTEAFAREKSFMISNKMPYVMDVEWLANIDTPRDFKIAAVLYEEWKDENFNH